ncbi:hypothetical protein [Halosegnis longus]|uniref:hypothetical protein n=1 Tax=Halosegnis longus TaxID=2216012 RepID=UPI00129DFDB0|nr:hypothetical protein [Halosegnis longus]
MLQPTDLDAIIDECVERGADDVTVRATPTQLDALSEAMDTPTDRTITTDGGTVGVSIVREDTHPTGLVSVEPSTGDSYRMVVGDD